MVGYRALCGGVALLLAACTFKGAVNDASFAPPPSAAGKLPASIALVDDGTLEKGTLTGPLAGCNFSVAFGPALVDALRKEFAASFTSVSTVAKPAASDTADFYALVSYGWAATRGTSCVELKYTLALRLVIVSRQAHRTLADYRESVPIDIKEPGDARAAAIAGALTLYALAPVTEPARINSLRDAIESGMQTSIETLAGKIATDMSHDQQLQTMATLGPVQDEAKTQAPGAPSPYDKFLDAVVRVKTDTGLAAGFFVTADGYVVTCAHVVADAKSITLTTKSQDTYSGKVVAVDKDGDLALVKVTGTGFATLPLEAQASMAVGRDVIAIGAPEGLSWSVSKGIVSAIRSVRAARVIQTDAAFGPGSSGGPVVDVTSGRVVGVASFTEGPNLDFAIASGEIEKAFAKDVPGL